MGDRPELVMEIVAHTIVSAIFFWGCGYVLAKRLVPLRLACASLSLRVPLSVCVCFTLSLRVPLLSLSFCVCISLSRCTRPHIHTHTHAGCECAGAYEHNRACTCEIVYVRARIYTTERVSVDQNVPHTRMGSDWREHNRCSWHTVRFAYPPDYPPSPLYTLHHPPRTCCCCCCSFSSTFCGPGRRNHAQQHARPSESVMPLLGDGEEREREAESA